MATRYSERCLKMLDEMNSRAGLSPMYGRVLQGQKKFWISRRREQIGGKSGQSRFPDIPLPSVPPLVKVSSFVQAAGFRSGALEEWRVNERRKQKSEEQIEQEVAPLESLNGKLEEHTKMQLYLLGLPDLNISQDMLAQISDLDFILAAYPEAKSFPNLLRTLREDSGLSDQEIGRRLDGSEGGGNMFIFEKEERYLNVRFQTLNRYLQEGLKMGIRSPHNAALGVRLVADVYAKVYGVEWAGKAANYSEVEGELNRPEAATPVRYLKYLMDMTNMREVDIVNVIGIPSGSIGHFARGQRGLSPHYFAKIMLGLRMEPGSPETIAEWILLVEHVKINS